MTIHILALETATSHCSVALLSGDRVFANTQLCHNQHALMLLPMIEQLLQQADLAIAQLSAITFGCGPGSFTGVRIATSVAQGLAFGINKPVIPLSTLQIMAQQAYQQHHVERALVALDARMQQIYYGYYELDKNALMQLHGAQAVIDPENIKIISTDQKIVGVGNGWEVYAEILQRRTQLVSTMIYPEVIPDARAALPLALALFQQGSAVDAASVLPIYLRDKVTQ